MPWSVERRLEFIDFRLYWEGRINRIDLKNFFGISIPQASADLRKYQELAPKNIDYDKKNKHYFATEKFGTLVYIPKYGCFTLYSVCLLLYLSIGCSRILPFPIFLP